ncbi:hypothetical protein CPB83DRAFT_906254 [Crepidotus variabilis]|uniref:Sacsin/Nov domain-containing protein n=1 Tax=Crepidotus variabilis TaxID=179855 RepID=A0A9P6EHP3_9AGAR|nr:hypothetical protein CPB83DRAFT_906254 [Crepidotus variabilis]
MVLSKESLWATGHDETVEVNQRALIDKVLARYSGEFTVFRELLQNSDDAQSKAVEIHFETQRHLNKDSTEPGVDSNPEGPLSDLKTTLIHQWTFKNNGILFRDEDWSRLKKIAEGNPDEEKIGAFGVGFYSLFSVTEEPFVSSGDQWMGFYWKDKKDQLYARRGQLPESSTDDPSRAWTSFTMALREPAPMPVAFDFTRFLASSITFMRHLAEITVYFDDKRLAKLTKNTGLPKQLAIPKNFKNRSPGGMMTVNGVETTPISIQAEVMKWIYLSGTEKKPRPEHAFSKPTTSKGGFFSSLFSSLASAPATPRALTPAVPVEVVNPLDISYTGVSLSVFSASIQVQVDKKTTAELVRSTKKNPPSKMKFELIYTAKAEYDSSVKEDTKVGNFSGSIFQGLRADLGRTGDAKVFIGHSTSQSTGIGGHIAARFIPTVERESIDFMDRYVAVWNKELLYVGGFLSRVAYEVELRAVQQQWEASSVNDGPPKQDIRTQLIARVLHALKFFEFHESHPSKQVSEDMRNAFFSCSSLAEFPMISSAGVRSCKDVRIPDPVLTTFVKHVPMIPDEILAGTTAVLSYLKYQGMIKDVEFVDILKELQAHPLSEDECIACLKWWITESSRDQHTSQDKYIAIRTQLLNAIIITTSVGEDVKILPLNTIKSYFNPRSATGSSIPLDGPLPDFLLPVSISKNFKPESLSTCFPWTEFNVIRWLIFICDPKETAKYPQYDLNISPIWAEKVIGVISRGWNHLGEESKAKIKDLLGNKTCIPTTNGMKIPSEAYFPNVNIFPDLPVVTFPLNLSIKGNVEKFLQFVEVRKHVDLQLIFHRMVKTNEWTVMDLVKYLVSIRDLDADEVQRLQRTSAFPKEMPSGEATAKRPRFTASQLYPPNDVFRSLGLPILDWGDQAKWRDRSDEAKFLYKIGLQRYPTQSKLIELCAGTDEKIRATAFQYLIDHIDSQYPTFDPNDFREHRFIPALKGSHACLANITEVYSRSQWSSMGFMILQPKYQVHANKLKIREHPSAGHLITLLRSKPPESHAQAVEWFSLLASRVNDFKTSDLDVLARFDIVPIAGDKGSDGLVNRWLPPSQCYLRGGGKESFHSKLFTFVDFGPSANAFLTACGTKSQPSVEEVARILLNDPHHFYELSGGTIYFLDELRNLAINSRSLSSTTMLRMKRAPILLGLKRKPRNQKKNDDDWDEDEWDIVYDLKRPDEIIVADDTNAYQAFGDSLYAAPQEDILEGVSFYLHLGSQRLSNVVREVHEASAERFDTKIAQEIRALILERLPLFLHEHTHTSTKVSFSWLNSGNNFVVKAFGKLAVSKQLNFGGIREIRKQDASAVSKRQGSGVIELWIATNAQPDMYEVATSLNRLLFESPKTNDALLFMTILSTDLRSLKRRGYNVERILRQQKEAKLAASTAEAARLKKDEESLAKQQQEAKQRAASISEKSSLASRDSQATLLPDPAGSQLMKTFQNFRNKLNAGPGQPNRERELPPPPVPHDSKPLPPQTLDEYAMNQKYLSSVGQGGQPSRPSTDSSIAESDDFPGSFPQPKSSKKPTGSSTAIPLDNIKRNIDIALESCKAESGNLLQNREHMQKIKESTDDGYCDISGRRGNLHNIAELGSVKIYLSEEVPLTEAQNFMLAKHEALARFCHIMKALANVYRLPLKSLHIFFDVEGGIIAFNRNGSIFLNFRYYEQWHDASVKQGNLQSAYISWYFSLAHEIAHNLVHPHNSEHEFYFSALCEHHMMDFTRLLGGQ